MEIYKWISKLVNIRDVNIEAITPKDKVIEKPLIGPEPNTNNNSDAIKVVILASKMVDKALSNPFFIDSYIFLFFTFSSFILSKISTLASTAIPIVKTMPAIPGNVRVAPIVPNKETIMNKLAISEKLAIIPNDP